MADEPLNSGNPYASPGQLPEGATGERPEMEGPRLTFAQVLGRGLRTATATPLGVLGFFVVVGVQQGLAPLSALFLTGALKMPEPGEPPPVELLWLVALGCFSCIWSLVMVFAGPWVTGGTVGQLRDRALAPRQPAGRFAGYGNLFYGRMLVLTLLFLAIVIALYMPAWGVGMVVFSSQMPADPADWEQLQELSYHWANITAGVVFALLVMAVGIVFYLADAIVVVENQGPLAALGRAWRFLGQNLGEVAGLYLIFVALSAPTWLVYYVTPLTGLRQPGVLLALGVGLGLWLSYVVVLNLGFAVSLYLGRRSA